ncbi:MAG TPA: HAMP domain-containing sensor histidine kinase [Streptosporangiales bacterium]
MRRRLAMLVAATTSLVLVAFLVPLAVLVRTVAADRAVTAATSQAQSLVAVVGAGDRASVRAAVEQANASGDHPLTVFFPDGTQVGAPARRTDAVELALRGRSLSTDVDGGRQVLVAVQGTSGGPAAIATTVDAAELRRGVAKSWLILALLGVALMLIGVAVADRLARTMVRPIGELSAVSHRLAGGDLDARAERAGPPEVRAVAAALNHLAGRIGDLLRAERESMADISHRLRTPLTALRLDAEALPDDDRAQRIVADVDALERAVTRVIADARRTGDAVAECDAAAVVRERAEFWSALAEDTGRSLALDLPDRPAPVRLPAGELAAALDALLGNVFAHTPDGVGLAVRLTVPPDGGARLVVSDEGPGFPRRLLDGAPERGASHGGSTGLGLDIARRAARESRGGLSLGASGSGGAEVVLVLGAPAL